ncbi:MAG: hypothetical protein GX066_02080 [Clostridiaceae bacterium]|nr:hypothetical protein [Clostridiaceae bacterium]
MLNYAFDIIEGIISLYFVVLSIYCGAVSTLVIAPYIESGGFYKEAAVARIGGIVYAIGSVALYMLIRIFL